MTRFRLEMLLVAALTSPACGGTVGESGTDAGTDVARSDTSTRLDTGVTETSVDALADTSVDAVADTSVDALADTSVDAVADSVCAPLVDKITCGALVTYPCGLPITVAATWPSAAECAILCAPGLGPRDPASSGGCMLSVPEAGPSVGVQCNPCVGGRRSWELCPAPCSTPEAKTEGGALVAETLANLAWLEAASVHAFRKLEHDLRRVGAPKALCVRARRAARDEVRHARLVGALARSRGGRRAAVKLKKVPTMTVFELALENAVEGCVRETFAVALLAHQAKHAADPELAALAKSLYEDELDHAALAFDLDDYFQASLSPAQRDQIASARTEALNVLREQGRHLDSDVRSAFGFPSASEIDAIVTRLEATLYAA